MLVLKVFLAAASIFVVSTAFASLSTEWVGEWKGELTTERGQIISTRLRISKVSEVRWMWNLQYGTQPPRPYEVRFLNGRCLLDEGHNVEIACTHLPKLSTVIMQYGVGENRLTTTYVLEGSKLRLETSNFSQTPLEVLGPVSSFVFSSFQRALLSK